ncbi:MAG: hypothetical protein J6M05_06030, partial [Cardiobacteriaceae bacterium]|nr:hypothetical protein [Cardiobacteriaceae bacterium]
KILADGILRAEDGNRYKFDIKDIENLSQDGQNLTGLEVDFELIDGEVKSLYITSNQAVSNPQSNKSQFINQEQEEPEIESKCVEIPCTRKDMKMFHGIALRANSKTYERFLGSKGSIDGFGGAWKFASNAKTMMLDSKSFFMGNNRFVYTDVGKALIGNLVQKQGGMLGALNQIRGSEEIDNPIETGDVVTVLVYKKGAHQPFMGGGGMLSIMATVAQEYMKPKNTYTVAAYKNHSKNEVVTRGHGMFYKIASWIFAVIVAFLIGGLLGGFIGEEVLHIDRASNAVQIPFGLLVIATMIYSAYWIGKKLSKRNTKPFELLKEFEPEEYFKNNPTEGF